MLLDDMLVLGAGSPKKEVVHCRDEKLVSKKTSRILDAEAGDSLEG